MLPFFIALNNNFKYKAKFIFNILSVIIDEEEIMKYITWITKDFLGKAHISKYLNTSKRKINGNKIEFTLFSELSASKVREEKENIERILGRMGYKNIELIFKVDNSHDLLGREKEANYNNARTELKNRTLEMTDRVKEVNIYKKRGYQEIKICDLKDSHLTNVIVEGEIFNISEKVTKTDYIITELSITDYECAIYLKLFAKKKEMIEKNRKYKVGNKIITRGEYQIDTFSKEYIIIAKEVKILNDDEKGRVDDSKTKRVEFNIKTQMSAMDGIATPTEIINIAKKWGHRAVAINDVDSLQSFPEFYNNTKADKDFTPIFGATFSSISRKNNSIYNPSNIDLSKDSYIVFDLETTDLSPILGDIIEFGAVKVIGGVIVEKKQFFINTDNIISKFTTELTGITKKHIENSKYEKDAILDIRDYIGDMTLVAHNANFDLSFLNEKLVKYGYKELSNPTIDSMVVARMVHPTARSFKLGTVAKRLNVSYDTTVAHRADYDANVLSMIWIKMIKILKEIGINNQKELSEYSSKDLDKKSFSNYITLIAKNQKGIKELFKIASNALTTNFLKQPTVYFEDLKDRSEVLLGTGGLNSRLYNRMFFGTKAQIIDEISHYDYIEVQPVDNYLHLINRGIKKEDIEMIIKFVVSEAKRQGKLVIATGGVRYINPEDKIYHQVYINAKGLGGVRHKLFKFNEEDPIYPNLFFRTTQEMIEEFSFLGDANLSKEIVVTNTNMLADKIEKVVIIKDGLFTPIFDNSDKKLEELSYKTAREIYGEKLPKIVEDRLNRELEPIIKYGFAVIYWISHLLVAKSLKDGYLVGSRGSVGSSFVATMTKITEVNPLVPHYICSKCKHSEFLVDSKLNSGYDLPNKKCPICNIQMSKEGQNIPFETFLGFDADKVPDIDLNFSGVYQPTIHNEVKVLFGENHSFRAGTISTVAEKTAFGYVRGWAEETGKNISKAFMEYLAKGIAGTKRTSGQHPGGIIVIPHKFDVEDFTPINYPANDVNATWKTTHFDFHAIHDNVLKLDLLGHVDPTAIKQLERLTGVNAKDIPFYDPKIISLFSSTESLGIKPRDINGETTGAMGIPEFGTKFVRGMLKSAKVKSFGDLISISGLSHGTDVWANNAEILVREKNIPISETISCRDNIMTDLLAKGVEPSKSFSIMEKVRKGKGITEDEAKMLSAHNIKDWYIDSLEKIKYMFPKAHATAYVMMAWRIAWFKVYHPVAYYATYLTTRADSVDIAVMKEGKKTVEAKLKDFIRRRFKRGDQALTNKEQALIPTLEITNELYARGFSIENISIELSDSHDWTISKDGKSIYPPFSAIDGLGDSVVISIIKARKEAMFTSIKDLKDRTSLNKTSINKLEELGALEGMSETNQIVFNFDF